MKKALYAILLICVFWIFTNTVLAEDFNITLNGSDTFEKEITLNLTINDFTEYDIFYGITANLNYDQDKLDISLIKGLNKFDLTYNPNTKKIVLYNPNGIKEKNDVLTIKFNNKLLKKDESTNITLTNVTTTNGSKDIKIGDITKKITNISEEIDTSKIDSSNSNNNNLSSIEINGKKIDFNKDILNYDIVVSNDTTSIDLTALAENKEATINGLGTYELAEGSNEITILVTSQSGLTKTYIINVSRESADANQTSDDLFIKSETKKNNKLIIIIPCIIVAIVLLIVLIKRKDKSK